MSKNEDMFKKDMSKNDTSFLDLSLLDKFLKLNITVGQEHHKC